jgi:type IV pilus assembly protein PilP
MQNNFNQKVILILVTTALLLSGCSDSKHLRQLQAYVTKLKQDAAATKNDSIIKGFDAPAPVTYEAKDLRSPFESNAQASTGSNANAQNSFAHPLQAFPVSMLRFKGTATQGTDVWAFIQTPDNKLYQVKLGDSIGDHYGKITQISSSALEVQEPVDTSGKSSTRIVTLRLKDASQ